MAFSSPSIPPPHLEVFEASRHLPIPASRYREPDLDRVPRARRAREGDRPAERLDPVGEADQAGTARRIGIPANPNFGRQTSSTRSAGRAVTVTWPSQFQQVTSVAATVRPSTSHALQCHAVATTYGPGAGSRTALISISLNP